MKEKNEIPEFRSQPGGPGISRTLRKLGPEAFNLFTWTPCGLTVSHEAEMAQKHLETDQRMRPRKVGLPPKEAWVPMKLKGALTPPFTRSAGFDHHTFRC